MNIRIFFLCVFGVIAFHGFSQSEPKGLPVGQKAPDFTAKDQKGRVFEMDKKLKEGPLVIIFYRGQWCPYCNKQLSHLEDSLSLFTAKGASIVAISPELPVNVEKTANKTKASYPLLHDDGMKIMRSYDVAFSVDPATLTRYKGFGIDLETANGENGANLPVPAVYIVNGKGIITFVYFDADYKKRPSVEELLSHL